MVNSPILVDNFCERKWSFIRNPEKKKNLKCDLEKLQQLKIRETHKRNQQKKKIGEKW